MKRLYIRLIKIVSSVLLLGIVLRNIDLFKVGRLMLSFGFINVFVISFFIFVGIILMTYKWKIITRLYGGNQIGFRSLLKIYWSSDFASLFGIGTIGAETYKVVSLPDKKNAILSIFVDRSLSLIWYVLSGASYLFFGLTLSSYRFVFLLGTLTYILLALIIVNVIPYVVKSLNWKSLVELIHFIPIGKNMIMHNILSVLYLFVSAYVYYFVISTIVPDIELNILQIVTFLPFLLIALVLPISIQGIGTREFMFYQFSGYLGVPAEPIIGAALVVFSVELLFKLLGAIPFALRLGANSFDS